MTEKARVFCSQCKFFHEGFGYYEGEWCQPDTAPTRYNYSNSYIPIFSPKEQNKNNDCQHFQWKGESCGEWLKGIFSFG